ncbi:MAG: 2-C-methyl-D-erythritol 4-phosphate cytidylyltransferase [Pseudomonadales bacterium]|nr:2-C-methyl-D-erythritol 4-phosphate cytidylyltransferase [Pseudomonadales bacterium]
MKIWAILPAAGIGRRMGSSTPKQYHSLCGTPVLLHSINRLLGNPDIEHLVVVLHPQDEYWVNLDYSNARVSTVEGGEERFNSVLNGLNSLADRASPDDWILVHDAVRPCVQNEDIARLIESLQGDDVGGLLGAPIDSTVKRVNDESAVLSTVDRGDLWFALTPQMFRFDLLHKALCHAIAENLAVTDEASAVEALGLQPKVIPGHKSNIKITHESDLQYAEYFLTAGDSE